MPNSLDDELRFQPINVVARRGNVWLRALLFVLLPAFIVVGVAYVYYAIRTSGQEGEIQRLHEADQLHRKAASDHEKEMAR